MEKPRVLLAVLAHPDDESFGMGGTLALYAQRGWNVYLICATRGEAGSLDPALDGRISELGQLRENELHCAAQILGLTDVIVLGFRDSGMRGAADNHHPNALIMHQLEDIAGIIVSHIRQLRPEIVLTFDPLGGYQHPDHIHIHRATKIAFEKADDPSFCPLDQSPYRPAALYYHLMPRTLIRTVVKLMRITGRDPSRCGKNGDIDLASVVDAAFPVQVQIDIREVWDKKQKASACHASQGGGGINTTLITILMRLLGRYENFMRAFPPMGTSKKRARFLEDLALNNE